MKLLLGGAIGGLQRRSGDRPSLETSMFKIFAAALLAAVAAVSVAQAADISGAGATLPSPV